VTLGARDYRAGALDRLRESQILLRAGGFGGSVYLAGRAVEGMLRAVIWHSDPTIRRGMHSLDTGHDLRLLLAKVRDLGLLRVGPATARFEPRVQRIARLWMNDMRFGSMRWIEGRWRRWGEVTRRYTMKQAAA